MVNTKSVWNPIQRETDGLRILTTRPGSRPQRSRATLSIRGSVNVCMPGLLAAMASMWLVTPAAVAALSVASQQRQRPPAEAALERYLCENFGGLAPRLGSPPKMRDYATSWFTHMKLVEVKGSEVWVSTNLHPDRDATGPARAICSGVSGFVFSNENRHFGLNAVRVAAKGGQALVYRRGLSAKCE